MGCIIGDNEGKFVCVFDHNNVQTLESIGTKFRTQVRDDRQYRLNLLQNGYFKYVKNDNNVLNGF